MKTLRYFLALSLTLAWCGAQRPLAADEPFNGLGLNLGNLYRVSKAQSRSISPENFTGEKGKAGMATEGTGKRRAARPGPGLEGFAVASASRPGPRSRSARSKGPAASSKSG